MILKIMTFKSVLRPHASLLYIVEKMKYSFIKLLLGNNTFVF